MVLRHYSLYYYNIVINILKSNYFKEIFALIGKLNSKKVLIIDDVLTAGTAIKNSLKIIKNENAELSAVLVALDREEKDEDNNFYRDNLFNEGIKIFSIAKISELD